MNQYLHQLTLRLAAGVLQLPEATRQVHAAYTRSRQRADGGFPGREGGSGLGLAVAQTLVAQNHGTIDCESRPGHTVFSIFLPLPT